MSKAYEAVTFAVTIALDRARRAKEARHDFVRHLTPGEQQAYYRCCKEELGLARPAPQPDPAELEDFNPHV